MKRWLCESCSPKPCPTSFICPKLTAQTGLNRFGGKRSDAAYIAARQAAPDTKVLALIDLKVPITPSGDRKTAQIRWQSLPEVRALAEPPEFAFLGEDASGAAVFACNIQPYQIAQASTALEALKPLVDLRSLALQGILSDDELMIAAQARALLGWHALNRCCVRCGSLRSRDRRRVAAQLPGLRS